MTDSHGIARDQLRAFIERIERLEEEKKIIADDIKDVYGEAKSMGYDTKIMKQVIALRKKDDQERTEEDLIRDTYLAALGMIPDFEPESEQDAPVATKQPAKALQSPRKAAEAVAELPRTNRNDDMPVVASGDVHRDTGSAMARTEAAAVTDRRDDHLNSPEQATEKDASTDGVTNPSIDSAVTGILAEDTRSDANTGGGHVTAQSSAAQNQAGVVSNAPAAHPVLLIRPHCQHPGEEVCGGSGRNHCRACAAAMREEVA